MSREALNKLGHRLGAAVTLSDEDLDLLAEVVTAYQAVLDDVREQLTALGLEATTRVKTIGTLLDKLRREQGMQLSRLQDLAGARIVVDGDRGAQDHVVRRVANAFSGASKAPKIVDRRADPRYGYRAVHVIVFHDGVPVEIQVRTQLQDSWAQIVESLGDRWGRAIRYGGPPDAPDRVAIRTPERELSRAEVLELLGTLSDQIAGVEERRQRLSRSRETLRRVEAGARNPQELSPEDWEQIRETLDSLRTLLRRDFAALFTDRRRAGREYRRIFGRRTRRGAAVDGAGDVMRLLESLITFTRQSDSWLRTHEAELRRILQYLASAADHGE